MNMDKLAWTAFGVVAVIGGLLMNVIASGLTLAGVGIIYLVQKGGKLPW